MPDLIPSSASAGPRPVSSMPFSGHSFQLGPVIGIIIDELIRTGGSQSPLGPFDIGRFGRADHPRDP